jgi:hypothetical protein
MAAFANPDRVAWASQWFRDRDERSTASPHAEADGLPARLPGRTLTASDAL